MFELSTAYNNKKKVKVTLVKADLEEIKMEHGNMTQTHSALFTSLSHLKLWRPGSANVSHSTTCSDTELTHRHYTVISPHELLRVLY